MKMALFYGDKPITANDVEIRVNPEDRKRAKALVARTSAITLVTDELTFGAARQAAGELKAMLDEIEADRTATKQGFDAVGRAIQGLAQGISTPVKTEQNRILALLTAYVTKLEAARKEQERREAEARRLAQAEADRKVREAEEARDLAQAALRAAHNEIEAAQRREEAQRRENQLLQQQLEAELALDVEELGKNDEPQRGLVPGGRVAHVYDFELTSVQQVCEAGAWGLLKWTLDVRACQDAVRAQLDAGVEEPNLAGIKITKRLSVSVRATSRIK
jgi:hypothetical protein